MRDRTLWWSPEPRAVFLPNKIHVSRSLAKTIRKKKYRVTADTCFEQVIRQCATTRSETWISPRMIRVMLELHKLGHAHSIETWNGDQLVGGLYGVAVGQIFFGESMFSTQSDASKVALVRMGEVLDKWGFPVIDCQLGNPYLKSMGVRFMPRAIFRQVVAHHVNGPRVLGPWTQYFLPPA